MHPVPEGSPLTNIPFISIGLCKVRIICTSATGLRGWSKRNYLLWSQGKFETAKLHPVRSRLKAPETLKGKKNECTEEVEELETEIPAEIRWFCLFVCLLSLAFESYIGFHFSIFEYPNKELLETVRGTLKCHY